uniref:Uncharacterized protein n=1 Tax=Anguilla anguilla TaxID=7936 RepID=A0A0E9Q238_ANGAN
MHVNKTFNLAHKHTQPDGYEQQIIIFIIS